VKFPSICNASNPICYRVFHSMVSDRIHFDIWRRRSHLWETSSMRFIGVCWLSRLEQFQRSCLIFPVGVSVYGLCDCGWWGV
jgi:hypothetical protein